MLTPLLAALQIASVQAPAPPSGAPPTDPPILIRDAETGVYERPTARSSNDFRFDWLVSYRPSPGTVIFAGYGSSLAEDRAFRFRDLSRTGDGFFLKVSYLFRI